MEQDLKVMKGRGINKNKQIEHYESPKGYRKIQEAL